MIKKINLVGTVNLIFYFFLLFAFLGVALLELASFVLLCTFLIYLYNIKTKIDLNKYILFFIFFYFFIFIQSLFSNYSDLKYTGLGYIRFIIFNIILIFFLINSVIKQNKNYLNILLLMFLVIIFDSIFQFFVGYNIFGIEIYKNRISSFFGNDLILGSFMIKAFPILSWFLIYNNFDFKKNFLKISTFFAFYFFVILISGERTAIFLTIIIVIISIIFISKLRNVLILSAFLFLIFSTLISNFNFGQKTDPLNRIFFKTFYQITNYNLNHPKLKDYKLSDKLKNAEINKVNLFSKDHQGHYELAINIFKNNVFFGNGIRGFKSYCRDINYDSNIGMCSVHPHNTLLQILSELGLLGLVFYLVAALYFLYWFFYCIFNKKKIRSNYYEMLMLISLGIIIAYLPIVPSGDFYNGWISYLNYYTIAVFYYSIKMIKTNTH